MKGTGLMLAAAACAAALIVACGGTPGADSEDTSAASSKGAPSAAAADAAPAPEPDAPSPVEADPTKGTIRGRVHLSGPAPANPIIRMGADPVCAALTRASGTQPIQLFTVVDATGGLANTFVSLKGTFPAVPPSTEPVTIIQRNCVYQPRVVGAQVGQTLRIINQDTTVHNVHSLSLENPFNVTQPHSGEVFNYVLQAPDVMLRLKCDVHSWMLGYVGVAAHPYFAVSGNDGTFTIANVPPGKQTLTTWHERFGQQTQTIEVTAGQTTDVDLVYDPTAKPSTARLQDLSVPLLASAQHQHPRD